jgi:hypothetical protein
VARALAIALALAIVLAAVGPAQAASLDLRVADQLDINAPSVTTLPTGATSVVALVGYRDLTAGTTISLQLLDASGQSVASYREPVTVGGSGTAAIRLIPPGPLASGTYTVQASVNGSANATATVAVGAAAPAPAPPGATPAAPGATPAAPGAAPTAPVQLAPRARGAAPELASARVGPVAPPASGVAAPPTDRRFGLANVLPDASVVPGVAGSGRVAWMSIARQAGAGGNRWELRWDAIERQPGVFDWAATDAVVAANAAAGLPLLAVLIGTPGWAGSAAGAPPGGLDRPPIMPDGSVGAENPWAGFVHALAARYRGRIAAYEIWNEPNRNDFWSGTPAEYYRLLSVAMAAVRHADPAATVVFGGLDGYRDTAFLEGVLDAAMADDAPPGRRGAFDALAWHAYHRPLDVYAGTLALRAQLRARGLDQPIWITETNVPAWDDRQVRGDGARPYQWSATAEEQAAYLLETFAYAVAADVERLYVYRASDAGEAEAWGLLRVDGAPRLAERAFRFATAHLTAVSRASRFAEPGVERIVVERPGERVTIAWATGAQDAPLVLDATTDRPAQLYDKIGGTGTVSPVDGRFVLSVPGASANRGPDAGDYLIGGDPYVIVEELP